ncbi:MAG TPA: hypothetical protein VGL69_06850 [Solirubrobacteraceae bacterium]|jgi:hypothetical protein
MDSATSRLRRRSGTALALLSTVALAIALLAAHAGPARAGNLRCSPMTAGHNPGIVLSAYDIGPIDMRCTSAEPIVREFLNRKLAQRDERCAGLAETPPYKGCIVHGFRCRATHRTERVDGHVETPQLCADGRALIYFAEHDTTSS